MNTRSPVYEFHTVVDCDVEGVGIVRGSRIAAFAALSTTVGLWYGVRYQPYQDPLFIVCASPSVLELL